MNSQEGNKGSKKRKRTTRVIPLNEAQEKLAAMTHKQLLAEATSKKVKNRSRMSKTELFVALGHGTREQVEPRRRGRPRTATVDRNRKRKTRTTRVRSRAGAKAATAPSVTSPAAADAEPQTSAPAAAAPASEVYLDRGAPIPDQYGVDRLMALVRDPQGLYVYWELAGGAVERLRAALGSDALESGRWVLRVDDGTRVQDVPIDVAAGSWYLQVNPKRRYHILLGLLAADGTYHELARGGPVETPPDGPVDHDEEVWMTVELRADELVTSVGEPWLALLGRGPAAHEHERSGLSSLRALFRQSVSSAGVARRR